MMGSPVRVRASALLHDHEVLLRVDAEDADRDGRAVAGLRVDRDRSGRAVEALRRAQRTLDGGEVGALRLVDRGEEDPRGVVREGAPDARLLAERRAIL